MIDYSYSASSVPGHLIQMIDYSYSASSVRGLALVSPWPATGFSPYTQRNRSSTSELGATGDTSVRNGITYHTSR